MSPLPTPPPLPHLTPMPLSRSPAASPCSNYDARVASDMTFRPRVNAGVLGTEAETAAAAAAAGGAAEEGAAGGAAAADGTSPARGKAGKEAVFSRLYQGGRAHEEALAAAQAKAEADALAACTFRPDTAKSRKSARRLGMAAGEGGEGGEGASPAGAASGDAHLRLYEQARERTERLRQQAAAAAAGSEPSFKPRISLGSRRLTEGLRHAEEGGGGLGGSDLPRHLLLYEDGLQRQQARAAAESNRGRDITEDDVVNCTFRPAITHVGGGGAPGRRGSGAGLGLSAVPVHDRLYEHARSRQTALAAVAAGYAPDAADGYYYPAGAGTAAGGLPSDGSGSPAPAASGSASARSGSAGHAATAAGAAEAGAVAFPSVRLGFPSPPTTGAAAGAVPRTLSPRQQAAPAAAAAAADSSFSSTAGAAAGAGGAAPASPKPAADPAAADGVASVSV